MAFTWTDENVEKLKTLWAQEISAREIGEELGGISRNSVIGKAHRLGLSAPKRKTSDSEKSPEKKPAKKSAAKKTGKIIRINPAPKKSTDKLCQWPIGDPGTPDFKFCHKPAETGRPYCSEHCDVAYRNNT